MELHHKKLLREIQSSFGLDKPNPFLQPEVCFFSLYEAGISISNTTNPLAGSPADIKDLIHGIFVFLVIFNYQRPQFPFCVKAHHNGYIPLFSLFHGG